jgi:ABC-type antimicrobial peptide transport system permease subunit
VVIISQSIAQRFFPGENPVGKQLHDRADVDVGAPERHLFTIIGVVGNVQHNNPESQQSPFQAYFPYAQNVWPNPINWGTLVIRSESDPRLLIAPLEKVVASIDPNLPLSNVGLFNDLIRKSFATKRLAATVVSLFSGAALLLAAVGLYGVLSYSVAQRKREIGVRIALGAESKNILQLVVKQGFTVVGVGLMIGVVAALALSHLIAGILYGVSVADPISVGLSVLVLSFTTLIACLLPAFRATRINPITALRE